MNAEHSSTPWPIQLEKVRARPEGKKKIYVGHFNIAGRHCKKSLKTARKEVALRAAMKLEQELNSGAQREAHTPVPIPQAVKEFLDFRRGEGISPKTDCK